MGSPESTRGYQQCRHGNHPKYCTHCQREGTAVIRPVESTVCHHGNKRTTCDRCKLPPIIACEVCKELTQTLVTHLRGNLGSAFSPTGWPLCCNECAFNLKLWLKIQTPRDEGETRGTVASGNNCQPREVQSVPDIIIGAGVEAPIS